MNAKDEAALALFQRHRGQSPMTTEAIERMESHLRAFFDTKTADDYEHQLSCVRSEMSCPETTGLDSPSL